ncbi:MBL fold metallo-hydrolase [Mucisphaera calidilacus]|uniref:Phosphoribosyl 1,2-cyclic phosphodiesterase n=1 Tax=Mucisphaera calidilacus TaxID=2527982 RepID=A0A518BXB7_9BACT|nr:MBL fold metallo-hydrolase [Mucisphaera calidilacus]QDU71606.1 Phosphoribosyl 1,2-cyclic phosphodiesterase [Mucisphaera calidilacus]
MSLELLFLGTGTSAGVPLIGCDCRVCTSSDPRDQRTRPSVVVRYADGAGVERQFLIDTTPELRVQCLREGIKRVDAVLYTHAHADHIVGTDDLRRFNAVQDTALDIYADEPTFEVLGRMFKYIFDTSMNLNKSFVATLIPHRVEHGVPFELHGATWTPVRLMHGRLPITGYRVDCGDRSVAYCTDVSTIPPESLALLTGLDVLVIDGLRHKHHPTHLTIDRACQYAADLGAKQTYLTHIGHEVLHAEVERELPDGVLLAVDGGRV